MKTLAIVLGILIMGLNLFVSFRYYKLFNGRTFSLQKRISLKILNNSIKTIIDEEKKDSLQKLKKYYKLLLFLFYLELIIVLSLLLK
jgi:hypothetical protein